MTEIEEKEIALAKEYLNHWQRELRLDHLDFTLGMFRPEEKVSSGVMAQCNEAPSYHHQKIQIRNPSDRTEQDKTQFRRDLEVCIVHELLHTKEIPWRDHPSTKKVLDEDDWLRQLHEDSLDAIAEALVRARRGLFR